MSAPAGAGAAFPPAPWRLRGACAVVAVPVRVERARPFVPAGVRIVSAGRWTLGGVLLAAYEDGATLTYRELIAFAALGRAGRRLGGVVSHIWVDSPESVAGGRAIWNLPKELAELRAGGRPLRSFAARTPDGAPLLDAELRTAPAGLPLPLPTAAFGARDGRAVHTAALGRLGRATVGTARLTAHGTLAALGFSGRWPVLSGTGLELAFPAPRG